MFIAVITLAPDMPPDVAITHLLQQAADGRRESLDALLPLVYDGLRAIAHGQLRHERAGHTLSTTALVHEAYLKLVDQREAGWQNRAHFYAVASQAMRRLLVDYARRRARAKRGGGAVHVPFDEALVAFDDAQAGTLVALDDALQDLEAINPRHGRVVECRYFGGLSLEETAAALGISAATVSRDWQMARAWLKRALSSDAPRP